MYLLLTNWLHEAESFLRSQESLSYSRNSLHLMEPEGSLPHSQEPARGFFECVVTWLNFFFGEELSAPRPTPKLEYCLLSAVQDWLFYIFAATIHIWRPFLHPQPEDAPCLGDRDPLITDVSAIPVHKGINTLHPEFQRPLESVNC